jgi:molybdenum cofactor guanylyltransferase
MQPSSETRSASSINVAFVGVLFGGGQSRRMGGVEKSLLSLGGKPMIARVIDALRPQVRSLVINANGDPARFASFGLPVVADREADFAGPLAGLLAGMEWVRAHQPDISRIATAACDTPFFPADLVARLQTAAHVEQADIALAASGGQSHFVFALWPVALADDLAAYLADGRRKVQDWIERHSHVAVEFPPRQIGGVEVDPFFNINTPDDLAMAETWLAKEPQ